MDETAGLVKRLQKGDVDAFEKIFIKYENYVFRAAYLMTGSREQAEDILQEVFIAVWKSRNSFNPNKARFDTWLNKITINRRIDNCRKERPLPPHLLEEAEELVNISYSDSPEDILADKFRYERLVKAMRLLDDLHRSVLILRYANDLSYKEIANVLEIPLGTVKSRIHNALCMLRRQLTPAISKSDTQDGEI